MSSERQIAANRQNALKSTGPRTQAGKLRSARNAYKHGLSGTADAGVKVAAEEMFTVLRSDYPSVSTPLLFEIAVAIVETSRARKAYAKTLDGFAKVILSNKDQSKVDPSILDKADRYVRRALSRKTRLIRTLRPKGQS